MAVAGSATSRVGGYIAELAYSGKPSPLDIAIITNQFSRLGQQCPLPLSDVPSTLNHKRVKHGVLAFIK